MVSSFLVYTLSKISVGEVSTSVFKMAASVFQTQKMDTPSENGGVSKKSDKTRTSLLLRKALRLPQDSSTYISLSRTWLHDNTG